MNKLNKYSTFEDLKSDLKPGKPASKKDNKVLLQFESFLNSLQQKFSGNKQATKNRGKQFS